ncbi:cob(I)yrinic acid a,c-diamide adenosyltransferase [Melioribacteraceae bacterium 4301-Me]|uniref:cob(I)yrinic acid a,c-diamide adenosyltransferase n=1 Tax=Pyranulibacter aquaticus TaxID=3163344 RepID=UPI00359B33E4
MKIYTKTGDSGLTSLFGGQRVWKSDPRIEAYGTIDELNTFLGLALCELNERELIDVIKSIQHELFIAGSDLATPLEKDSKVNVPRVTAEMSTRLEKLIDEYDSKVPPLNKFILPGGTKAAAVLHIARTICRRAERKVVESSFDFDIGENIKIYLNRLSDLLFVLARYVNKINDTPDIFWEK